MTQVRKGYRGGLGQTPPPLGLYGDRSEQLEEIEKSPAPAGGEDSSAASSDDVPEFSWRSEDWTVEQLDEFAQQHLEGDAFETYPASGKKGVKLDFLNGLGVTPDSTEE